MHNLYIVGLDDHLSVWFVPKRRNTVTNDRDKRFDLYAQQILERWDAYAAQLGLTDAELAERRNTIRDELDDKYRRRLGTRQVNLMDALRRSLES